MKTCGFLDDWQFVKLAGLNGDEVGRDPDEKHETFLLLLELTKCSSMETEVELSHVFAIV